MKVKRRKAISRTRAEMDDAMVAQINHARLQNIPINQICACALFAEKINRMLYGEREPGSAVNDALQKLIADARAERARVEMEQREAERRAEQRIILPGGRN